MNIFSYQKNNQQGSNRQRFDGRERMKFIIAATAIIALCLSLFNFYRIGLPLFDSNESLLNHTDSIALFMNIQANQFSLLQTYISIFGIIIAIAGVWGYTEIQRIASKVSADAVKDAIPEAFNKFGEQNIQRMIVREVDEKFKKENEKEQYAYGMSKIYKDPNAIEVPND